MGGWAARAIPRFLTPLWRRSPSMATSRQHERRRCACRRGQGRNLPPLVPKAALITDALVYWRPDLISDDAPDTGSLTGDFEVLVERAARNDHDLISNYLVLRVALEAAHDPELATALDDLLLQKGRRTVEAILNQAAARGEISGDRDWSLVADVLAAMALMRVLRGQTVNAKFVRQVIDMLVLPAIHAPSSNF
jgi:hypothetical protein